MSHHLRGYGHPILWLRYVLQPFGIKTLSQAYALVRINPCEVGWLLSFFHAIGWRNISDLFGNPFLWPTVFRWAVRVISHPSCQLWKYCVSRDPGQISLEDTIGIKSWSRSITLHVQRLFIHQSLDNISWISQGFYDNPAYSACLAGSGLTLTNQSYERWPSTALCALTGHGNIWYSAEDIQAAK